MRNSSAIARTATVLSVGILLQFALPLCAQTPSNPAQEFFKQFKKKGSGNAQKNFERLFGEDTEEDRKILEKITVSPAEERKFGNRSLEAYLQYLKRQKIRVATKGADVEYLQALIATLKPQMRNAKRYKTIRVIVAKSPRVDARSFPGGTLVFFKGMLEFAENEAALAGVVGHELSHLDNGHQLLPIKRQKRVEQVFSGRGKPKSLAGFFSNGKSLMRLWSRPFRPEDERQADHDGATWAYKSGYDPREMAKLFLRLHEQNGKQAQLSNFVPSFLRSHPFDKDRYEAVMLLHDELQKQSPQEKLYIGGENLKRRIARTEQEFAE